MDQFRKLHLALWFMAFGLSGTLAIRSFGQGPSERAQKSQSVYEGPGISSAPAASAIGLPEGATHTGTAYPTAAGGGAPLVPMMAGSAFGPGFSPSQAEEMQLGQHARRLLDTYNETLDDKIKQGLKAQLKAILARQFELQHNRRAEELEQLQLRLAELRAKLEKRANAKSTIVERRLEQLVSDLEGLGWGEENIPQDLFEAGMMGGMGGMPAGRGMIPSMPGGTMGAPSGILLSAPPQGTQRSNLIQPQSLPETQKTPETPTETPSLEPKTESPAPKESPSGTDPNAPKAASVGDATDSSAK